MFFTDHAIISILFALFGLIVGSFLNVVILRRGKKTLNGRSQCPSCHHQLSWYELIPVISFLVQRGSCRHCNKRISSQYITIEIITAITFYFSGVYLLDSIISLAHPTLSIIGIISFLSIISFAIIIAAHDAKTRLVPLPWFIGLVLSTIVFLINYYIMIGFYLPSLFPHLIGIIIASPFLFLWLISRGKWMGFADIELIAWMGLYLGVLSGISATVSAFYLGTIAAVLFVIIKMLSGSSYTSLRSTRIPFAPFLLISWFITVMFSWNLFSLLASLFI